MARSVRPFARIFGKSDEDMLLVEADYTVPHLKFTFRPGIKVAEVASTTIEMEQGKESEAILEKTIRTLTEKEAREKVRIWQKEMKVQFE